MTLDAGGLAKGFTADLLVAYALSLGATSACINLGGDMAIHTPVDAGWKIEISHPVHHDQLISAISVSHGGIATSTVNARLRTRTGITSHIFTSHGPVSAHNTVSATVIANTAAWAEAWTKYAMVTPIDVALEILNTKGFAALLIDAQDTVYTTSNWSHFNHE
jgi:thiamine biosynthesis lipoprotein